MNEQTTALVAQLAAKLGTTSEYLWAVLVKQAPITGTIILVEYALTILLVAAVWRFRKPIGAFLREHNNFDTEILYVLGSVVVVLVSVVWLLACVFTFSSMLTAFLNPEYWALKEVLSAIKAK